MADFGLDLKAVEEHINTDEEASPHRITLGVLDGTTPPREWIDAIDRGEVLVLAVEGELNELAARFAPEISEAGGDLVHFREFLIVTPPDIAVDTDRLG